MKLTPLSALVCLCLLSSPLVAQTSGIAELASTNGTSFVEGFVVANVDESWVVAEFEDSQGVIGYSDALLNPETGDILAISDLNLELSNDSLSMNLYAPGEQSPFAMVVILIDDGVIHELTDQNPNPPNENGLALDHANENWLRDKVLGVTSQDNPKIYRTQAGKNLGDFVVVRFGKAVVIEIKTPTGGDAVDDATVSDGSPQIDRTKDGHVKTETGAGSVTGGITVTFPTNPDNDDWTTVWNRIKELTPPNN